MTAQCDVSLDIVRNLVRNDVGAGAFHNEDALVVILLNDIRIRERLHVDLQVVFVYLFAFILLVLGLARHDFGRLNFGRLKRRILNGRGGLILVVRVTALVDRGDELDVDLGCAADVRLRTLSQLDAGLAVLNDNVATDVGLALLADANNAVVATRFDLIAPDDRRGTSRLVVSHDLDAVLMGLLYQVVHDSRLVVEDLN